MSPLACPAGIDYETFFAKVTGFAPYAFQRRVASALLGEEATNDANPSGRAESLECGDSLSSPSGRGLILNAPTGAGKTWAVLIPFIYSRLYRRPIGDRLLYALPLRSLADSLYRTTHDCLCSLRLERELPVRLQTGETGSVRGVGDPLFAEGRIIFCTVDQLLSSYLGIPFSVSPRMANINAGALVGSLVVFDEYHLLDPDTSLRTGLLMARHLAGVARVVWMTATQAKAARELLCEADYLNAKTVDVAPEELRHMPSQRNKRRTWRWSSRPISASAVAEAHAALLPGRQRSLVIVNTVKRAQRIYRALKDLLPQCPMRLLHSRFLAYDRAEIEVWAREYFKRGALGEAILVATQVVEAGLDISATQLHTELAPANALVQRAGRCARYEGEVGIVFVYDTIDDAGKRYYQPYGRGGHPDRADEEVGDSDSLTEAIDRTAVELARSHDSVLGFHDELALIDAVHTTLDGNAVRSFDEAEWRRKAAKAMSPALDHRNYGQAREMIRDIDSVSVAIADESRLVDSFGTRLAPQFAPETVSVSRVSIAALSAAEDVAPIGTWALMAAQWDASAQRGAGFTGYVRVALVGDTFRQWLAATYQDRFVVLNPAFARYTPHAGLELGVPSGAGDWQSTGTLTDEDLRRARRPDWCYRAETYRTHVAWVQRHAQMLCGDGRGQERRASARAKKSADAGAFDLTDHAVGLRWIDARLGLPSGTARELALLAARVHDLGKLNQAWQEAVWRWQQLKASRRDHYPVGSQGERAYEDAQALLERARRRTIPLAHTDFDAAHRWPSGKSEREIERQFRRPGHALEGAWLAMQVAEPVIERANMRGAKPWQALRTVVAAVAQHHAAGTGLGTVDYSRAVPRIELDSGGMDALRGHAGDATHDLRYPSSPADWEWLSEQMLVRKLHDGGTDWDWRVLDSMVHRITRLADQRGTAIGSSMGAVA